MMYELSKAVLDDRLRDAERARRVRSARRHAARDTRHVRDAGRAELVRLLEGTERLPVDDAGAWDRVRAAAHRITTGLAADGLLPRHLVVDATERPVLVPRILLAAVRRLSRRQR